MERGVNEVDPRISVNPDDKLQMEVDQLKRRKLEEDQVGPKGGVGQGEEENPPANRVPVCCVDEIQVI